MRTEPTANDAALPWYRHRWPWLLMAGPFAVLVAGFITMWISFSGADALVVDDYYKQGKAINQDLRRDQAAAALGLSASLRYGVEGGVLSGQLIGAPDVRAIQLRLVHPTVPAKDLRFSLQLNPSGSFSASLPLLERARWQVQLEDAGRQWRLNGSWSWPEQKAIDIQALNQSAQGS
jgi:hypothetical protein